MTRQTGTGRFVSPYRIRTLCQLQDMRSSPSVHYVLATEIDARWASTFNDEAGFEPIALGTENGFSGSFVNSAKHVITGLTIDRPSTDNVGLFSHLASGETIRGVILQDSRTTGRNKVGALVGAGSGVIEDSRSIGSVYGEDGVGGLVGYSSGRIGNSYATGSVTGSDGVGGLVGYSSGRIGNSYATGSVTGSDGVGGLVGILIGSSTISNSYSLSTVTGTNNSSNSVAWWEAALMVRALSPATIRGRTMLWVPSAIFCSYAVRQRLAQPVRRTIRPPATRIGTRVFGALAVLMIFRNCEFLSSRVCGSNGVSEYILVVQ